MYKCHWSIMWHVSPCLTYHLILKASCISREVWTCWRYWQGVTMMTKLTMTTTTIMEKRKQISTNLMMNKLHSGKIVFYYKWWTKLTSVFMQIACLTIRFEIVVLYYIMGMCTYGYIWMCGMWLYLHEYALQIQA